MFFAKKNSFDTLASAKTCYTIVKNDTLRNSLYELPFSRSLTENTHCHCCHCANSDMSKVLEQLTVGKNFWFLRIFSVKLHTKLNFNMRVFQICQTSVKISFRNVKHLSLKWNFEKKCYGCVWICESTIRSHTRLSKVILNRQTRNFVLIC